MIFLLCKFFGQVYYPVSLLKSMGVRLHINYIYIVQSSPSKMPKKFILLTHAIFYNYSSWKVMS